MMKYTRSKHMQHKLIRLAIGVPETFNALSASGGGIALLLGTYKDGVLIEAGGNLRTRNQHPAEIEAFLAWRRLAQVCKP
jgi:hypothetical protein